jgi:Fic family protein
MAVVLKVVGTLVQRNWLPELAGIDMPRRLRVGGPYSAYIPDELVGRTFTLDGRVAADVADAERAITRLDNSAMALTNTEALARLLLRAEAAASSHIEGLSVSPQRLLRVSADIADGLSVNDTTAIDVLANVDAMNYALEDAVADITIDRVLEVHRRLLEKPRAAAHAGVLRTEQNWIGGNDYTPIGAAFVPPPPEKVQRLLTDLCTFCNDDSLPAVVQAGIAHAQFETIHPFADGNGRTGRALIYMVLRKRGLAIHATPPISLILATRSKDYVALLGATRFTGPVHSAAATEALNRWIEFFATACTRAVADAESFERRVSEIQADWRNRLPATRSHAAARILIERLPETPIITVAGAAKLIGRTFPAVNNAIETLVEAGILVPTKRSTRGRTFEAKQIIDAFTLLERQLASPEGNTRISKPNRTVPARPRS